MAGLSGDLSDDQRDALVAKQDDIRNGRFDPFQGPITDNTGNRVVVEGASLNVGGIKGMNFVVKGIDMTLPS